MYIFSSLARELRSSASASPLVTASSVSFPLSTVGEPVPLPKPRAAIAAKPEPPKRKLAPPSTLSRVLSLDSNNVNSLSNAPPHQSVANVANPSPTDENSSGSVGPKRGHSAGPEEKLDIASGASTSEDELYFTPGVDQTAETFDFRSTTPGDQRETDCVFTEAEGNEELGPEEDKENVETFANQSSTPQRRVQDFLIAKGTLGQEGKLCAVISTIPKCEHLDTLSVDYRILQSKDGSKDHRRTRIPRTASNLNDFETNSLERQKRHLTSHAEDITFALNLNVASNVGSKSDEIELSADGAQEAGAEVRDGGGKTHFPVGASGACCKITNTVWLL